MGISPILFVLERCWNFNSEISSIKWGTVGSTILLATFCHLPGRNNTFFQGLRSNYYLQIQPKIQSLLYASKNMWVKTMAAFQNSWKSNKICASNIILFRQKYLFALPVLHKQKWQYIHLYFHSLSMYQNVSVYFSVSLSVLYSLIKVNFSDPESCDQCSKH